MINSRMTKVRAAEKRSIVNEKLVWVNVSTVIGMRWIYDLTDTHFRVIHTEIKCQPVNDFSNYVADKQLSGPIKIPARRG